MARVSQLLLLLGTISFASEAFAGIHSQTLNIVNAQLSPDGFSRSTVVANSVFPGSPIVANKGDNLRITVNDQLTDPTMLRSTTIHWHGIFQEHTNWADGPAFVTQCPIAANNSFLYNFNVPDQAGTYWYHSHLAAQYCDGLRGALVIKDPLDPFRLLYDVDNDDTIITLADWYHTPSPAAGAVPVNDATLINGLGRYTGGPASPLAVINVQHGKRYRFRLVSISCDPNYNFTIDGHTMTVIEVDGVNVQPLTVDLIPIYAAQRYSFILHADQPVDNYWVRALPNLGGTAGTFANGVNSAILRYSGAATADPTTTQAASTNPLSELDLHPLTNPHAPGLPHSGGADVNINMALAFDTTSFEFTINGVTFVPPTVPVLLQILSGTTAAQDLLPAGSVYTLPPNKVIEISLPGLAIGGPHPFHLHGHTFSVVRSAGSSTYNYVNPVQRDTVSTGLAGDNVTIRFVTDNPGPWFLHCHIDWHLQLGFAVVMAEAPQSVPANDPVPAAWSQLCPIYDALDPSQL